MPPLTSPVPRWIVRRVFDTDPKDGAGLAGVIELIDSSGGLKNYTIGESVADLTELAAVVKGLKRQDRQRRFVESEAAQYAYDEQASSGDVQPDDSDGTGSGLGNGWWNKYTISTAPPESAVAETVIETTDDIKTILEAATDGSAFVLQPGLHAITGVITITSKKGISIRGPVGAVVSRSDDESAAFKIEGCEDFVMEGFTIRAAVTGASSTMLDVAQASAGSYLSPTRHRYADLHLEQTGVGNCYAWYLQANADFIDSTVDHCQFTGNLSNCISAEVTGGGKKLLRSSFVRNHCMTTYADNQPAIGIESDSGDSVLVADNFIFGAFQDGIICSALDDIDGVLIRGNFIDGVTACGIKVDQASSWRVVVENNIIRDSGGRGIQIDGKYTIVSGNSIISPTTEGIIAPSSGSENLCIDNNFIYMPTGLGISVDGKYASVCDNSIWYPVMDGIKITGQYSDISDNVVVYGDVAGIVLVGATECSVDGNTIADNSGIGLTLDASSNNNVISGNMLRDNNDGALQNLGTDNEINGKIENSVATTNDTETAVSTIAIPDDTSVRIEVSVTAFRTNGADQATYKKAALVYRRSAGVATLQGTVQDMSPDIESDGTWEATVDVDGGNNARVQVTGANSKNVTWKARHTVEEVG